MTEHAVLAGGGEMGALMRSMDWSKTALGPVETWPQSLRTTVSTCLSSRFPILVWWGPDFVKIYNDAYRPMLGNKHPQSMGQRGQECWPEIWHIIGPMLHGVMERGEATWSEDQFLPLERHGFAEECYFTYSYSPIRDETGGIGGVFCAVTETTRRVLGERRLRTLRDVAARTAHAKLAEEACTLAAEALSENENDLPFFAIYLLDREGEPRLAAASFDGVDASRVECALAQAMPRAVRTSITVHVDDSAALVMPFGRSRDGRPLGLFAAGISPRLQLDEEYAGFLELVAGHLATAVASSRALQEAQERAEMLAELDRAKTAFFSNVSHEFRTPLTLMVGPLEDMLGGVHGDLAPAVHEQIELAYRNALRLLKLVNSLLDFARLEAGRMQAVYEPVDLARITTEAAGTFRAAIERAGLRLLVDCRLFEPVFVDVEMWDKIVLNLLSNALKFTFEGDITVRLRGHADAVVLEVTDTGIGIAPEEIPNLFKRFHRIHAVRSRTHEGSGIGLALVQDLVGLHGGRIACESEPGRGTTFRVTIPFGRAHLPSERIQATRDEASTATRAEAFLAEALRWVGADEPATTKALARVLVADDNADMRDYLQRILSAHWEVEAVADGEKALEAARRVPPALVLSDVMMPGLDGFALLAELKRDERTRHVPVVMLSARAGEESRVEGLQAGADDYLVKPFSARELVARVSSQIKLAQARREADLQRAHLHALFMQAPTPICILRGPDHIVELANTSCCEVWGKQPESVVGSTLFEVLPELESQVFKGYLRDVLTTGTPYIGKEIPALLGSDGTRRQVYFNFVYAPLRDADDCVDGVLVLAFDVTDEVRARDELARTIQANELFAGVLGHDLRNPLAAIMYAAELLLAQSATDAVTLPAKRILTSGRRISRMIDQLLDFTRIRLGGGLGVHPRETDLEEIVKRVVAEVEDVRERKFRLVTLGNAVGFWDPDRIAQVVSNLAGNAAQHGAPDGEIEVRLDARAAEEITLAFSNDGAIPPELLPRLFEPFQGGRKKHMHSTGLGLGLFISKEIIAAHGGRISAASHPDGHAELTVVIPRAPVDRPSPEPKIELVRPFS